MNLDTVTLQCFLAVAATNSFTKAAKRVGRTQSAVSQQISRLENLLGKELVVRGKTTCLTSEGEMFRSYANKILGLQLQALNIFTQNDIHGSVRFGLPEDFATLYLAEVLSEFVHIHPKILLNVECDLTLNLFDRFKEGVFDLVLVKMSKPEDFPYGVEVWTEKLEWVGNSKFYELFKEPVSQIPLVLSPQPCVYRAHAIQALENNILPWKLVFSSTSYNGKIAAVSAGLGITVLPKAMVPSHLKILKTKQLPALSDTHVSLLKHKVENAAINSLEEFVIKMLRH